MALKAVAIATGVADPDISYTGTPASPTLILITPALGIYIGGIFRTTSGPWMQDTSSNLTGILTKTYGNVEGVLGDYNTNISTATSVLLPKLKIIEGSYVPNLPAVLNKSLPAITVIGNAFSPTLTACTHFSMNAGLLAIGGDFAFGAAALDQASVDGILVSLAALDGTKGTVAYANHAIDLTGGTNAAPSAVGLAAKALLVARSNTVTTN